VKGSDLRKQREAAGVRAADLAKVLGVTRSAITHLEGRDHVQPTTSARFLNGVAMLAAQRRIAVEGTLGGDDMRRLLGAAFIDMGAEVLAGVGDG
jgi:transcriptional regulator with XRE-family HTH domain